MSRGGKNGRLFCGALEAMDVIIIMAVCIIMSAACCVLAEVGG